MIRKISFDATVICMICHWPFQLGYGYWCRKPERIYEKPVAGRYGVICTLCHRARGGWSGQPRIREQALLMEAREKVA